jgi:hypothetical protein
MLGINSQIKKNPELLVPDGDFYEGINIEARDKLCLDKRIEFIILNSTLSRFIQGRFSCFVDVLRHERLV